MMVLGIVGFRFFVQGRGWLCLDLRCEAAWALPSALAVPREVDPRASCLHRCRNLDPSLPAPLECLPLPDGRILAFSRR